MPEGKNAKRNHLALAISVGRILLVKYKKHGGPGPENSNLFGDQVQLFYI